MCGSRKPWQELTRKLKSQQKQTHEELSSESPSVAMLGPGFLTLLVTCHLTCVPLASCLCPLLDLKLTIFFIVISPLVGQAHGEYL